MEEPKEVEKTYVPPAKVPPEGLGKFAANFKEGFNLGAGEQCWTYAGILAAFRRTEVDGVWSAVFSFDVHSGFPLKDFSPYIEILKSFWLQVKPEIVTTTVPDYPPLIEEALEAGFLFLGRLPLSKGDIITLGWRLRQ